MICQNCDGHGIVDVNGLLEACEQCHCGQVHCCDGMREQPEKASTEALRPALVDARPA